MEEMKYVDVHSNEYSDSDVYEVIKMNNEEVLKLLPIQLGFNHENWKFVQDVCVILSEHAHPDIRGNALLALTYVAMIHKKLEKNIVKPLLLRGLKDEDRWVKGRAQDALDDINTYMKWKIGSAKKNKENESRFCKKRQGKNKADNHCSAPLLWTA